MEVSKRWAYPSASAGR